ncbi:MAG TPA: hypothetical protein VMH41_09810 [Mycobacteriales bacterium]|nr:hypothetical protein [Mycobacteriales bacterium]
MADASVALGGRQIAGTWINRRGTANKLVSTVAAGELGGAVGSFAADRVVERSLRAVVETPEFGRDAYLAVGENDVAVVRAKQGLMKLKLTGEVVARAARSDVTRVELGGGKLACPLTITFNDGARWEFDVPRGGKSAAERVITSLGG